MDINITSNIAEVAAQLGADARQVPFAASRAINRAMFDARKEVQDVMQKTLKSPTRYTINALRVVKSDKNNLAASLDYKNTPDGKRPAEKWMYQQVEGQGVTRPQKAFERKLSSMGLIPTGSYLIPTDHASIDANGNWRFAQIRQIVLDLGQAIDKIAQARLDKRKTTTRTRAARFFIVGFGDPKMHAGIYQKLQGRGVQCIATIDRSAPVYRTVMPFYASANKVALQKFNEYFPEELKNAAKTAK